ncbi:MAG: choice-of-anchor J domain-containing protein, partial [Flavobacteriales bacterium]|nr:choice-of-anchor J domain-containing protein [Flavobacteriales bacterium]
MKNVLSVLLLSLFTISFNAQCHYVFDMQDSWGDGWNGASIEVNINGAFAADITCNGGASIDSISTMNGDVVDLSFVSGNWDTEITFQIYDPSGALLLSVGPFANNDGNDAFLLSDTSNSSCVPQFVNVTFQVDMNKVTSSFTIPELNGSWNGYCGNCDPMSDPDVDNVWEKTISLFTGSYEYIFSADSLVIQENINTNAPCSNGSFVLPRRFLNVGAQDITLPLVCWESCDACNDFPQPPTGISCNTGNPSLAFSEECDAQGNWTGDFGTGNGIWQSNTGLTPTGGTGPDGAHSGSNYFYFESSTFGNGGASQFDTATIVTPMIDLTNSLDDAELTFWLHARGDNMGSLTVGLSNSPTGPFTNVYSQFGETHANDDDPWSQIGIDVSNYLGQNLYVSFTYMRNFSGISYSGDLCIDLIEVNTCSTCPPPSSLTVSNITANSADIAWTPSGTETEWMLYYNGVGMYTNTIPTTLTNLSASTLYNCNVSAICSPNDTSGLSSVLSFTTGCAYSMAPITENFDNGFSPCWSQELSTDDFDWTLNDGGTNSNN